MVESITATNTRYFINPMFHKWSHTIFALNPKMDELPAQIDLPRSMGLNLRYCSRMVQYYDSLIIFEPMLNVIKAFQVEQVN